MKLYKKLHNFILSKWKFKPQAFYLSKFYTINFEIKLILVLEILIFFLQNLVYFLLI